jgi:hypothetical protein
VQKDLQIAALQHDLEQPGTLQVIEGPVAQTDEESLVGTFLENRASVRRVLGGEARATNNRLDAIQLFVTFRKEVLEAQILPGKQSHSLTVAMICSTPGFDLHFCCARCRGIRS